MRSAKRASSVAGAAVRALHETVSMHLHVRDPVRSAFALAGLLVGFSTACGGGTEASPDASSVSDASVDGAPPDASCVVASPVAAGYHERTMMFDGVERAYTFYVPTSGNSGTSPQPVVIALHGGYGTANHMRDYTEFNLDAEREGFVVVYPAGKDRAWNAGHCCGVSQQEQVDDVGFIEAVIDVLASETCVDQRRIYATGISNGSMMVHRLACESTRIAAIAGVGGQLADTTIAGCNPGRRIPVLHIHGTADGCAVFDGGVTAGLCLAGPPPPANEATLSDLARLVWRVWFQQVRVCDADDPPVLDPDNPPEGLSCMGRSPLIPEMQSQHDPVAHTIDHWASNNNCAPNPTVQTIGSVDVHTYDCEAPGALRYYKVIGGGHAWPGKQGSSCCEVNREMNTDIDANQVMWEFFRNNSL